MFVFQHTILTDTTASMHIKHKSNQNSCVSMTNVCMHVFCLFLYVHYYLSLCFCNQRCLHFNWDNQFNSNEYILYIYNHFHWLFILLLISEILNFSRIFYWNSSSLLKLREIFWNSFQTLFVGLWIWCKVTVLAQNSTPNSKSSKQFMERISNFLLQFSFTIEICSQKYLYNECVCQKHLEDYELMFVEDFKINGCNKFYQK